jgi:hypothetical protein
MWITTASKDSTRFVILLLHVKEGCLFITSDVGGCSFSKKGSKQADLSFGEFANGNLDKFACNGYWVPSASMTLSDKSSNFHLL